MMITRLLLLVALLAVSPSAVAQEPSIAGTWVLAAADKLLPDGTRVADYGENPHGLFAFFQYRSPEPSKDLDAASESFFEGVQFVQD